MQATHTPYRSLTYARHAGSNPSARSTAAISGRPPEKDLHLSFGGHLYRSVFAGQVGALWAGRRKEHRRQPLRLVHQRVVKSKYWLVVAASVSLLLGVAFILAALLLYLSGG